MNIEDKKTQWGKIQGLAKIILDEHEKILRPLITASYEDEPQKLLLLYLITSLPAMSYTDDFSKQITEFLLGDHKEENK